MPKQRNGWGLSNVIDKRMVQKCCNFLLYIGFLGQQKMFFQVVWFWAKESERSEIFECTLFFQVLFLNQQKLFTNWLVCSDWISYFFSCLILEKRFRLVAVWFSLCQSRWKQVSIGNWFKIEWYFPWYSHWLVRKSLHENILTAEQKLKCNSITIPRGSKFNNSVKLRTNFCLNLFGQETEISLGMRLLRCAWVKSWSARN